MTQQMLLGGRYELLQIIGRGGMAEVWKAQDTRLSRLVAVKRLRVDLASDPSFQARFRKEAHSAAGLNHPNIVAVYDTGEQKDQHSDVAVPYIVMELVEGHTLRDILRDDRKILPEKALEFTAGVLDALAYSHTMGIIHRDIKPANVMLTNSGVIKVMDFGIARAVADTSATMTQTAAVIGTAQYLSPEQARGEKVDARSDIYSTGCLLYELLTGRPPFQGDSPVSVAYQHVREAPTPPSQIDPAITSGMDTIVLKSLTKDPTARYQTARQMRDDITRILSGERPTAVIPAATPPAPATQSFSDAPTRMMTQLSDAPVRPQRGFVVDDEDDEPKGAKAEPKKRGISAGAISLILLSLILVGVGLYSVWYFTRPAEQTMVAVPNLSGQNEISARSMLQNSGLELATVNHVAGPNDSTVGLVIDQDPLATQMVPKGSKVSITINDGPEQKPVPSVTGMSEEAARDALTAAGFTNIRTQRADPRTEPITAAEGEVTEQMPKANTKAGLESEITLTLATGTSEVPNFMGKTKDRAEQQAAERGFTLTIRYAESSAGTPGTVIAQNPSDGNLAPRSTPIEVTIATEPSVPTVTPSAPAQPSPSSEGRPGNSDRP